MFRLLLVSTLAMFVACGPDQPFATLHTLIHRGNFHTEGCAFCSALAGFWSEVAATVDCARVDSKHCQPGDEFCFALTASPVGSCAQVQSLLRNPIAVCRSIQLCPVDGKPSIVLSDGNVVLASFHQTIRDKPSNCTICEYAIDALKTIVSGIDCTDVNQLAVSACIATGQVDPQTCAAVGTAAELICNDAKQYTATVDSHQACYMLGFCNSTYVAKDFKRPAVVTTREK